MRHKQVIRNRLGNDVLVDEGLADLLQLMWNLGFNTWNSCQENRPGIAWIEFISTGDCTNFLNLIDHYSQDDSIPFAETLYGRVTGLGEDSCNWRYNAHLMNYGETETIVGDEIITTFNGYNDFHFSMSIRFPVSDIPLLVEILKQCPIFNY
jgi:hypothetical protein